MARHLGALVSTALTVLIAGCGWLYPLASFAVQGLSLSGMHDEATGFLYFYSLRRLYGVDELPWLHSGQLPSLLHLALQLGLTAAGYPPEQLHPRLDIWSYLAPAVPLVSAALLLGWAVQPLRSWLARVPVAVILVAVAYETAGYLEYPLTTPGYHPWVHPVAAVLLGWLLRVERSPRSLWLTTGLLGLYAGLCLSIKPTYLPFVVAIGVPLLLQQATVLRALALAVGSALIAALLVLATTWGMYAVHVEAVVPHFEMVARFAEVETSDRPPGAYARQALTRIRAGLPTSLLHPQDCIFLAPLAFAVGLVLPERRRLSLALLVGSLLYAITYDRRPSFATQVEVFDFLAVALVVWMARVVGPAAARLAELGAGMRRLVPALSTGLLGVALVGAAFWAQAGIARFTGKIPPAFQVATDGEHQLERFLDRTPGRTMFALLDYGHRPVTVDAAIHRGGILLGLSWEWSSPLLESMFPDRDYVMGPGSTPPVSLRRYRKLVYAYRPGTDDDATAQALLRERFGIQIDRYDCSFTYTFWDTPQPLPSTLTNTVVARGCVRQSD